MAFFGGLVGASCFSIAAGVYILVRREPPPMFHDNDGRFWAPRIPPASVRRWGYGLVAFGVLLAILTVLSASTRHAQ